MKTPQLTQIKLLALAILGFGLAAWSSYGQGQPAADADYTYKFLTKEQTYAADNLVDAHNEFTNANTRFTQGIYKLAEMNTVLALLKTDSVLKKIDGEPARISTYSSKWLPHRPKILMANYLTYKNDAYELQNSIKRYVDTYRSLFPGGLALIDEYLRVKGDLFQSPDWETKAAKIAELLQGQATTPGDITKIATPNAPVPPVTPGQTIPVNAQGQYVVAKVPLPAGTQLVQNSDGTITFKLPDGTSVTYDPAANTWILPDGTKLPPGTVFGPFGPHGENVFKLPDGTLLDAKGNKITPVVTTPAVPNLNDHPIITDSEGNPVDIDPDMFDPSGLPKKSLATATYIEMEPSGKTGKLTLEREFAPTFNPGSVPKSFVLSKVYTGKSVKWKFQISSEPGADANTASYKLVNDGDEPASFAVEKWEMVNSAGEVVDTSNDEVYKAKFPSAGSYVIKVYGKTSTWNSRFVVHVKAGSQ